MILFHLFVSLIVPRHFENTACCKYTANFISPVLFLQRIPAGNPAGGRGVEEGAVEEGAVLEGDKGISRSAGSPAERCYGKLILIKDLQRNTLFILLCLGPL